MLVVGAHGAVAAHQRLGRIPRSMGGPFATSDLYLGSLGGNASAPLAAALDAVDPREEIWYVGRAEDAGYPNTIAHVSYLAWPRRLWAMACEPGGKAPSLIVMAPLPGDVRRPLYGFEPPAALGPRKQIGSRLWLATSTPDVPWTQYCSS